MDLNKKFNETLKSVLNDKDYSVQIQAYINEEESIKEKLIEIVYEFIEKDNVIYCRDLIEKMLNEKYINVHSIDIASCLIEYIKENIFKKYLKNVFKIFEDNNIISCLLDKNKNNCLMELVEKYFNNQKK